MLKKCSLFWGRSQRDWRDLYDHFMNTKKIALIIKEDIHMRFKIKKQMVKDNTLKFLIISHY